MLQQTRFASLTTRHFAIKKNVVKLIGLVFFGAFMTSQTAQPAQAAEAAGSRPVMKVVMPDGKLIYTDRELSSTISGKAQPLKGGQALVEKPSAKQSAAVAVTGAGPVVAPDQTNGANILPADNASQALIQQQADELKAQEKVVLQAQLAAEKMNCDNARKALISMQGRVTRANTKGEKEMLNDEQMNQEKQRSQKQIIQFCK